MKTRNLLSVCIWLRWPAALLAIVVWTATLASYRWSVWFGHSFIPETTYVYGALGQGRLGISSMDAREPLAPTWRIEPASAFGTKYVAFRETTTSAMVAVSFAAGASRPLWPVGVPLVLLAAVGFVTHRRRVVADTCRRCRYALWGAAVCPECGTAVRKSS